MTDTRATVSLAADASAVAGMVKDRFGFADLMDVARFGAAVAMTHGLNAHGGRQSAGAVNTWNLGSLDRDGELRALVRALYPDIDDDPGVTLETLMNKGLTLLGDLIADGNDTTLISLVATVGAAQPPAVS